jgi:hypothetical protein
MAESVKNSCKLFELMLAAASILDRTTLQHIAAGAPRHRTTRALE